MSYPAGAATRDITIGPFLDEDGDVIIGGTATIEMDRALVWSATGATIYQGPQTKRLDGNGLATFTRLTTDQSGVSDGNNGMLRDWTYTAAVNLAGRTPPPPVSFQLPTGAGAYQVIFDVSELSSGGTATVVDAAILAEVLATRDQIVDDLANLDAQVAGVIAAAGSASHSYLDGRYLPAGSKNALTGWFHADGYGAKGDGVTIDRAAIQAALDAAGAAYTASGAVQRVYLSAKTYLVDAVDFLLDSGAVYGAVSLMLPSGVELFGSGTIKTKNGAYGNGALYGIVRSKSGGISNASIRDLAFDGNTANQIASQQCNNIALTALANVKVTNTRHLAANGNAIIVYGPAPTVATNVEICDNTIVAASMIGIQVSHFNGIIIRGNYVANTTNNGIDIYGDDGSSTNVDSTNFVIADNILKNNYVGIFPETVAQGTITGNMISGCVESGVHVNRIHGQPHDIVIANNTIATTPYGVYVSGDTGGVQIRGNTIAGFTSAGVQLGGGGGNVSNVIVDGNTLNPNGSTVPLVQCNAVQAVNIRVRGTITTALNRSYDYVTTATSTVNIILEPTVPPAPVETRGRAFVNSAGTFTIDVGGGAGGTLTLHASAGGAWDSVWTGIYVSSTGGGRVDVTALNSDFTTPGQAIASVAGSSTSTLITVTMAASGSSGVCDYVIRPVTPS